MITSIKNPTIQNIRKLLSKRSERHEQKNFIIEGVRLLEEALSIPIQPDLILFSSNLSDRGRRVLHQFIQLDVKTEEVHYSIMEALSDTETPQGVLAVCPFPEIMLPTEITFTLLIDGISDPGNLGTILRTALAAGVDSVFILPGTVDPFSPKVVRSAMGAHFKIPICILGFNEMGTIFKMEISKEPVRIYTADSQDGLPYWEADLRPPVGLIIGSEAIGPSEQSRQYSANKVWIPMSPNCESLNASIAAGILLFEVVRQTKLSHY